MSQPTTQQLLQQNQEVDPQNDDQGHSRCRTHRIFGCLQCDEHRPSWDDGATSYDPLKQHNGEFYTPSMTNTAGTGWSYEVEMFNTIYRISTFATDFIIDPWTNQMENIRHRYHAAESSVQGYRQYYGAASQLTPLDHQELYKTQKNRYRKALDAIRLRVDFATRWPNAYEHPNGKANASWNHWYWLETGSGLFRDLEQAQKIGQDHFDALKAESLPSGLFASMSEPPAKLFIPDPEKAWMTDSVKPVDLIGKRIFAMSPDQYEILRQRSNDGKDKKTAHFNDPDYNWEATPAIREALARPYLPPLKGGLPPSAYDNRASVGMRMNDGLFERLVGE